MANGQSRRSFLRAGAAGAVGGAALSASLDGLVSAMERTPRSSSPSELRITGVRGGLIRGQHSLFVKIHTNQGLVGHGQAVDGVYGAYYVMKHIAEQHLVGRNPLDVHRLQEDMRRGGLFKGAQAGMYVCVCRRSRRRSGTSPARRSACPSTSSSAASSGTGSGVYCDTAGSRLEPEEMGRRAREDVEKYGFTAVKFDIDDAADPGSSTATTGASASPSCERMVAQIAAVRAAVGPHVDVCVDCHGRFDEQSGHKIAKAMEPFNLMWLEEPVPGRVPGGLRPHPAGDDHAHLRRGELVPGLRVPAAPGERGLRHRDARPAEGGRAR